MIALRRVLGHHYEPQKLTSDSAHWFVCIVKLSQWKRLVTNLQVDDVLDQLGISTRFHLQRSRRILLHFHGSIRLSILTNFIQLCHRLNDVASAYR